MKRIRIKIAVAVAAVALSSVMASRGSLIITGVFDGSLFGGEPKGIELYATTAISDLSTFSIGSANNGGGSDGEELTFSGAVAAGVFIYVANDAADFNTFFGFSPTFTGSVVNINGDDAIELFSGGSVIDVFGDINVDGNGQPWEYEDGWAYRNDNTGPDGTTFDSSNWSFSGVDGLNGGTNNATADVPMPIGTYSPIPEPSVGLLSMLGCLVFLRRRR